MLLNRNLIKNIVFLVAFTSSLRLSAQEVSKSCSIVFHPMFGETPLKLNDTLWAAESGHNINIETLKFYISGIELLENESVKWKEENSFHLVDMSDKASLTLSLNLPLNTGFNKIKFSLGIDSVTNISGAMGGDLDPTKGMYWTWQSGYINFKLEGKSDLCPTRLNRFQFHIGGYQFPYNCTRTVLLEIKEKKNLVVEVDVKSFLKEVDLANCNEVTSPGRTAWTLSDKATQIFSLR